MMDTGPVYTGNATEQFLHSIGILILVHTVTEQFWKGNGAEQNLSVTMQTWPKATITRCDLSPRFFCVDATLLCEFESDKI